MTESYTITATLWMWNSDKGASAWHFLTIDGQVADDIHAAALLRRMEGGPKRGWGSLKVRARICGISWDTSIFPDKASGGWFLPVKAAVRKAEQLVVGDAVTVRVDLL